MLVLVVNHGSSTLKLDFVDVRLDGSQFTLSKLAHGGIDRAKQEASFRVHTSSADVETRKIQVAQDEEGFSKILSSFQEASFGKIEVVGHRIVHGGNLFTFPALLDDKVFRAIENLKELAPLHNQGALEGIRIAKLLLKPDIPMVAVFDTAFHHSIPEHAATYALPRDLTSRHRIKRYGFHGIAHAYMMRRYCGLKQIKERDASIITLQLGNGCSVCAIKHGKSVDTSMGFTPLEGLVMGTRSGDLDPGVVAYLAEKEKLSPREIERILNEESGLLGVSGRSADMRDLVAARKQDPNAALAVDLFCHRAKKYIGAYLAALGGAEAILFGGGIGEHVPEVRAQICDGMEWLGLRLDSALNKRMVDKEGCITAKGSKMEAYAISVDESAVIAEEAVKCLVNR